MAVVKKVFVETQSLNVAVTLQVQANVLNTDDALQLAADKGGRGDQVDGPLLVGPDLGVRAICS